MSNYQGFFKLQAPTDLLEKLRHDFARIKRNPTDTYAAFDFFVTAEHILDWIYPDEPTRTNKKIREDLRNNVPELRVTSHIANGGKHFEAQLKHHKSVDQLRTQRGIFSHTIFDPEIFNTGSLIIELLGDDATEFGTSISVRKLAERVLKYWETNIT